MRLAAAALLLAATSAFAQLAAPNVVEIAPRLVTSGQPSAEVLAGLRASPMVFLYGVLAQGAAPEQAYQAVAGVWTPQGPWKKLVVTLLAERGIAFEPY